MAHVCFHARKRVHTRLSAKDRTQGHTRRNRGLLSLGHSRALRCQRNSFYSATLLYTYISRFPVNPQHQQQLYLRPSFIAFFNFSHKRPTFAFTSESGYTHSAFGERSHTAAHTAKQGAFQMGVVSLPSERSARSQTSPGRVSERQTLPLLVQHDLLGWKDLTKRSGRVTITRNDRTDSRLALVQRLRWAVK